MEHIITLARSPDLDMPMQGRCIYCRKEPPDVQLTREHIIPDGIGGNLVLPDGSCRECANIFKEFEGPVMTTSFGMARDSMRLRSKKRRGRARRHRTTYATLDHEGRRGTEEYYPINPFMPSLVVTAGHNVRARILTGETGPVAPIAVSMCTLRSDNIPHSRTIAALIDPAGMARFVAKIAHCYAVAAFGIDGFLPYLVDFIKGPGSKYTYTNPHLIGSVPRQVDPSALHKISVRVVEQIGSQLPMMPAHKKQLVVVTLSLFCPYDVPDYEIVAGEIPSA
jgi:hypothetical protein